MQRVHVLSIAIAIVLFGACKKTTSTTTSSTAYAPSCTGTTPTFSADVSALIISACASAGCHNAGSHQGPGALTTYTQIKSAVSSVRSSVVSASMPQGTTLTTAQKNTIVCWIDAGANNN